MLGHETDKTNFNFKSYIFPESVISSTFVLFLLLFYAK